MYRAPNADDQYMQKLYDHILKFKGKNLIITGDFNLPQIDWYHWRYGHSLSCDLLIDIVLNMNLHQVVHAPTRGSNILDLLFVSDIFSKGVVEIENGISDHQLNSFMVSMSESHVRLPHEKTEVRDYHKADDESIIDYLDLHLNIVDRDVELSWQAFTGTITYCTDKFIPLKSIKKPLSNLWLSRDIIQTRRRLKKMKKKQIQESNGHRINK